MTTPTDWREMCTELLDVIDSLPCETNYKGESRCVFPIDEDVVSRARFALNQSEPEGHAMLNWSEERQPCEDCRYNHCVAETPFGKFVISWKGWKEYSPVTVDESPFGDWFECWNSVENAKAACQTEYSRRLAIARWAHPAIEPEPERPSDEELDNIYWDESWRAGADDPSAINEVGLSEFRLIARAVLARFTRPAIEPVPIAERLPEPEDCDAEGKCWWSRHLNKDPSWDFNAREWFYTQWLPYHALPLPTNEQ